MNAAWRQGFAPLSVRALRVYAAINAIQLGLQGGTNAKPTDMGSLWADQICDDDCVDNQDGFMPIKYDEYELVADDYMISNFDPHPDGCDCEDACPHEDCGP